MILKLEHWDGQISQQMKAGSIPKNQYENKEKNGKA
jgi:hypothetical protein